MEKHRKSHLFVVMCLVLFIGVGCQPSQTTQSVDAGDEPAGKLEPPQQKEQIVTKAKEVAKPAKPEETVAEGPSSKIVLTKSSHDFGKVGPSTSHKAHYEFKNEGEGALLIKRIQSTCGCSKPALIKDGKRYDAHKPFSQPISFEPGETGQVEVVFKSSSVKGKASKHLYVFSNDPQNPRAQLELTAEVVVKVTVEPETVDLRLDVENAGIPDLVVKSSDEQEFSIKSVYVTQKEAVNIPFDPAVKATEFTLKPLVDVEKLGESTQGIIRIETTHPQSGTLMVRYNIKQTYELANSRFILQNVEPGEPIIRENIIRSNYGKPVEIESSTSRNGYMKIVEQEPDGEHLKIKVEIIPPERNATSRRYITDELTINLKNGEKLSIRCSGWFRLK